MYLEYSVRVPPEAGLRDARALLARLHDQAEASERFDLSLLHLDGAGRPRHAPAAIRIGTRGSAVVISAIGSEAVGCLLANASKAGALVVRHFGIDLEDQAEQGECDLQTAPRILNYFIPSLVLLRRNFEREQNGVSFRTIVTSGSFDHPLLLDRVSRVIRAGIDRQASICLLDSPDLLLADFEVHRLAPVLVKPGVYFVVGAVSFRSGTRFAGPWYAGYLQSRGYGRLFPARIKAIQA